MLQFRGELAYQLIGGRTDLKKMGRPSKAVPEENRFNREFHYLQKADGARCCVVHKQDVRVVWKCAACERHMCVDQYFYPYRAMRDFKFDDSSKNRCKSGRK